MDIDIISIDLKIQEQFNIENQKVEEYIEKIKEIKKIIETEDTIPETTKTKMNESISYYESVIENINNKINYNFYITESTSIIEKYKNILRTPIKISFLGAHINNNNHIKEQLITDFIQIAKKYINIVYSVKENKEQKLICENCKSSKLILSESIFFICLDCGTEKDSYINTLSYKDISRTNILQKYTYERRTHFRDCINQFQGKQNCKIDKSIYDNIEDQLEKHGLLVGDKDTKKEIRFSKIKKTHIMMFLKELNYDKQYENANYIYSYMTGVKCPDISQLEEQLMSDFDMLVNLYIKKFKFQKKIDRKSFMNINYVFFQLLNKNKYPCNKDDFNILKTIDRKAFHDDVFKELFEELGWNHQPFF